MTAGRSGSTDAAPGSADALITQGKLWPSVISLFASSGTLLCCALPALLVTLGAGAVLASLVSRFPQLIGLSENKTGLFVFAASMLAASGAQQWHQRRAACPVDPALRHACLRTRQWSRRIWACSVIVYLVGGWFAFGPGAPSA